MISKYRILTLLILNYIACDLYSQYNEQIVKAAFIEKFTNYIQWPLTNMHTDTPEAFVICVLGDKEFGKVVDQAFKERKLKNTKVKVISLSKLSSDIPFHVLYLTQNNPRQLEAALHLCESTPFLIISETNGFAEKGAHINFYVTDSQTIHFEMNKTSLDRTGFDADYLLLEFARVIME